MKLFVYGTLQRKIFRESVLDIFSSTFIKETRTKNKYPMFLNDANTPALCDKINTGNIIEGELWEVQDIISISELERGYFLAEIEIEDDLVWVFMKHYPYLCDKTLLSSYGSYSAPEITLDCINNINIKDTRHDKY